MRELRPVRCGCGGEAQVLNPSYTHCIVVMCGKCGINTPYMNTEAEAVEAWNMAMGWVSSEDKAIDKGLLHLIHAIMKPHEIVVMNVNLKGLNRALEALPERHKEILTMYYCEDKTLEEIGNKFGVTRERIRQLREYALSEMRHPLMRKWYCEVYHE